MLVCSLGCDHTPKNLAGQVPVTAPVLDSMASDTQWLSENEFQVFKHKSLLEHFKRSEFQMNFEDFPADIYAGKKVSLDYQSHPVAKEYKTEITNQYQKGNVNFAGHYILAHWRCGAPCADFAIVDVKTGKVYYPGLMNIGNFDFKKDSKLLVLGQPDSLGFYPTLNTYPEDIPPKYYLWKNNQMTLLSGRPE